MNMLGKSLIVSMLLIGATFLPAVAQTLQPDDATRTLRWVSPTLVEVTIESHEITQKGFYLLQNRTILRHGLWTMWTNGEKTMAAHFDKGKMQWLENSNGIQYTTNEIDVRKTFERTGEV